jgi:hypothetical protein
LAEDVLELSKVPLQLLVECASVREDSRARALCIGQPMEAPTLENENRERIDAVLGQTVPGRNFQRMVDMVVSVRRGRRRIFDL